MSIIIPRKSSTKILVWCLYACVFSNWPNTFPISLAHVTLWTSIKYLNYNFHGTFGYICYPFPGLICPEKLSPKSTTCAFLGYAPNHTGFLCYFPLTAKTYTSRHVVFYETTFSLPNSPFHSSVIFPSPKVVLPMFLSSYSYSLPSSSSTGSSLTHVSSPTP